MSAPQRGFTLLELIVAVAIFAVVATMAYGGLDLLLRSQSTLDSTAARQRAIDLAVLRIERNLAHALARPARGPYGDPQPAMQGSAVLAEWSVLDLQGATDGIRPQGMRVRYAVIDDQLWRAQDAVLDRTPRESARQRPILDQVERISFRYLVGNKQRLDQWPPRSGITAPERLPRGVEVALRLKDVGEIVRVVELPEAPR